MAWGRGAGKKFFAKLYNPAVGLSPPLSPAAVTDEGFDAYAYGESGVYTDLILQGQAGMIGAGLYIQPGAGIPFDMENLQPLHIDGSAQRHHPAILSLAQYTPIGTGNVPERNMIACPGAGTVFDMAAWAQGLGQIANQIGLVYGAGTMVGAGATMGAGVIQMPFSLPSDFTVSTVSTDGTDLTIPNASGLPFDG
jgi:hypothetical protein